MSDAVRRAPRVDGGDGPGRADGVEAVGGLDRLDRFAAALDRVSAAGAWAVLPLALLLFLQWPLRDLVGAGSRDANDAAQWIFALYVALAVRAATRARAHLGAGLLAPGAPGRWRQRVERWGEAVCVLPWALFVLVAGAAPTWRSLLGLEAFPDTFNPLYFVIRCSAWLLALGVAVQAVLDLCGARPATGRHDAAPATDPPAAAR